MASPLTVARNNYHDNEKNSTVYTPPNVSRFLFRVLKECKQEVVFDPAVGRGSLTEPFRRNGSSILGCDIDPEGEKYCDVFVPRKFEDINRWNDAYSTCPDLVICNPPFNGASGRRLYPEVFIETIDRLLGAEIPVVMFCPMGFRLNQRLKSKRWRSLRSSKREITSIISLPIDLFDSVEFHSEILMFNVQCVKPHYFLDETCIA